MSEDVEIAVFDHVAHRIEMPPGHKDLKPSPWPPFPIDHPLWETFVEWVRSGASSVRTDLVDKPNGHWLVIWEAFLEGWQVGEEQRSEAENEG